MTKTTMTPQEVHNYHTGLVAFINSLDKDGGQRHVYEPDNGPRARVLLNGADTAFIDWGNPYRVDESVVEEIYPHGAATFYPRDRQDTDGFEWFLDDSYMIPLDDLRPDAKAQTGKAELKRFYKDWGKMVERIANDDAPARTSPADLHKYIIGAVELAESIKHKKAENELFYDPIGQPLATLKVTHTPRTRSTNIAGRVERIHMRMHTYSLSIWADKDSLWFYFSEISECGRAVSVSAQVDDLLKPQLTLETFVAMGLFKRLYPDKNETAVKQLYPAETN